MKMYKETKASIWYGLSIVMQKIFPWIVMIMITHSMPVEEYGRYTVFFAWVDLCEILLTLKLYGSGYISGLTKNTVNKGLYIAYTQALGIILIITWMFIVLIFHNLVTSIMGISSIEVFCLIAYSFSLMVFGIWSGNRRVEYKYISVFSLNIIWGLLGSVFPVLIVSFLNLNQAVYVIIINSIIHLILSLVLLPGNLKELQISKDTWCCLKQILSNSVALVPFYISTVVLSTSDRIMIQKMVGNKEAAIYSVAYSVGVIPFVFSGALNMAIQPMFLKKLNDNKELERDIIFNALLVILFVCLGELLIYPELISLIAGEEYYLAGNIIPPIILSIFFIFIYQQFVNALVFYEMKLVIFSVSMIGAAENLLLNAAFIPKFGYYIAGYTTLVSYITIAVLYGLFSWKCMRSNTRNFEGYYNIKKYLIVIIVGVLMAYIITIIDNYLWIRVVMLFVVGNCCILFLLKLKVQNGIES